MNGTTPLDMNGKAIRNVLDPVNSQDVATRHFTDASYLAKTTTLDAVAAPVANVTMSGKRLTQVGDPVDVSDAVNLLRLNSINESLIPRSGIRAMIGNLDLGSQKIINLAQGTSTTDAVTKQQLDTKADQLTTYTKTETTNTFKPIAQLETKIQNITVKSKIECTGDNAIQITSNNNLIGTLYAPTG